jgi:hypothetical protein
MNGQNWTWYGMLLAEGMVVRIPLETVMQLKGRSFHSQILVTGMISQGNGILNMLFTG